MPLTQVQQDSIVRDLFVRRFDSLDVPVSRFLETRSAVRKAECQKWELRINLQAALETAASHSGRRGHRPLNSAKNPKDEG